ncbi:MAG: MopE-related protein [Pseudomonadota bacterium]
MTREICVLSLLLSSCWVGPQEWDDWEADHGEFDTEVPEGDTDTDLDTVDDDGDGFSEAEGDCDDGSPSINPSATDIAGDDIDQNCDGVDGTDADRDGYASQSSGGTDCDDHDAGIHPEASEVWYDGVDQDCDGGSDYDQDRDGYDAAVFGGADCDDEEAATNPTAEEECGNGVDDNCDGGAAGCAPSGELLLGDADAILVGENEGDHTGCVYAGGSDLTGDGLPDLVVAAPAYHTDDLSSGAVYVLSSIPAGQGTMTASLVVLTATGTMGTVGTTLSMPGDITGDGQDDLLIGAPGDDQAATEAGSVVVVAGPISVSTSLEAPHAHLLGQTENEHAGNSVDGVGDIDGDGTNDIVIAGWTSGVSDKVVYLIHGPISGQGSLSDADTAIRSSSSSSYFARSVSGAGDFDGDGLNDIVVGADHVDDGGYDAGAVYVFFGPASGVSDSIDADLVLFGEDDYDHAGHAVADAGDVDADGYGDLIVGATGLMGSGGAYVVLGPRSGSLSLSSVDATLLGEAATDYAGKSVASAGDVDDDGHAEVLVGAYYADPVGSNSGAVYLVLGPISGSVPLAVADVRIEGESQGDMLGYWVSGIGDLNDDGSDDLAVGALHSDRGVDDGGALFVFYSIGM